MPLISLCSFCFIKCNLLNQMPCLHIWVCRFEYKADLHYLVNAARWLFLFYSFSLYHPISHNLNVNSRVWEPSTILKLQFSHFPISLYYSGGFYSLGFHIFIISVYNDGGFSYLCVLCCFFASHILPLRIYRNWGFKIFFSFLHRLDNYLYPSPHTGIGVCIFSFLSYIT